MNIILAPELEFLRIDAFRICRMLGLKDARIELSAYGGARYHCKENIIYLCPKQAARLELPMERILAHELRHQYQHHIGRLEFILAIGFLWDGEPYDLNFVWQNHSILPWEQDARAFEQEYMQAKAVQVAQAA